jgi:hypothetical protein
LKAALLDHIAEQLVNDYNSRLKLECCSSNMTMYNSLLQAQTVGHVQLYKTSVAGLIEHKLFRDVIQECRLQKVNVLSWFVTQIPTPY